MTGVRPGSAAEKAGLQAGDELVQAEGVSFGEHEEDETPSVTDPGEVRLKVRREGQWLDLKFAPDAIARRDYTIREMDAPSPRQAAVREGLLTGR